MGINFPLNLRAIVAVSRNGVIGHNGHIPWHFPEELKLFQSLTIGHTVIMGRKTLESLKKPLKQRRHWILSRSQKELATDKNVRFFQSADSVLQAVLAEREERFWVIGGAEIYRLLCPQCVEIVQTIVNLECAGDTFWTMPEEFRRGELLSSCEAFETHLWHRKENP
jgi:dihydrofolate reductase